MGIGKYGGLVNGEIKKTACSGGGINAGSLAFFSKADFSVASHRDGIEGF
jgi:hypothetical protein